MSDVTGTTLLRPLSDATGISLDQLNFVVMQLVALGLAFVYRKHFSPRLASVAVRHWLALGIGTSIGLFCFGREMVHLFAQAGGCYMLMKWAPAHLFHMLVFAYAMLYLSGMHMYNMIYNYGNWTLDITGPLMILTQKLTSLAFSIHDGMHKKPGDLKYDQKKYAVSSLPSPVVFFSYVLAFQGLLAGPICFFNDYIAFVEGKTFPIQRPIIVDKSGSITEKEKRDLCPNMPVLKKVAGAFLALALSLTFAPRFPKIKNVDTSFIESTTFPYRILFLLISVMLSRFRYYFGWLLGEAVNNASGLGFNGFDENGRQKWDLVRNVDIKGLEGAKSWKEIVDNWNTQTAVWLKTVCYERVHFSKTLMTYCLSAVWHGFYPGYYFSFVSAAFATMAARTVRRNIRPMFLDNPNAKRAYDVVTWFSAQLTLAYLVVPFTASQFWLIMGFYHYSMYWFLHVIIILILIFLPYNTASRPRGDAPTPRTSATPAPVTPPSPTPRSSTDDSPVPMQRLLSQNLKEVTDTVSHLEVDARDGLGFSDSTVDSMASSDSAQSQPIKNKVE